MAKFGQKWRYMTKTGKTGKKLQKLKIAEKLHIFEKGHIFDKKYKQKPQFDHGNNCLRLA